MERSTGRLRRLRRSAVFGCVCATAVGSTLTVILPESSFASVGRPLINRHIVCNLSSPSVRMTVTNASTYPDDQIYVALTGIGGSASPCGLIDTSVPLSTLPKVSGDPTDHSYYFDMGAPIGSGLIWYSIGAPITGLPTVQPSPDTTPYRFANVEFTYFDNPNDVVDMTNVNQFSFPINLDSYNPDGTVSESSHYSSDTCTIVSGLRSAAVVAGANWNQIEVDDPSGNFVRVVSPTQRVHQPPGPFAQGWPSMAPYVESLAGQPLRVEGLYSPAPDNPDYPDTGWYDYTGSFDASTGILTLTGTLASPIANGPDSPGRQG